MAKMNHDKTDSVMHPDSLSQDRLTAEFGGRSPPSSLHDGSIGKQNRKGTVATSVVNRNFVGSPSLLQELTKRFPAWSFNLKGGSRHPHPLGALERVVCEEMAYRVLTREYNVSTITDIGGNANRHAFAKRYNIHSCNPILCPEDAVRRRTEKYHCKADYCTNTSGDCDRIVDGYLSVHSLYYLSRDDILQLLKKCNKGVLVAVVHRFNDLYGSMHVVDGKPESFYTCAYGSSGLEVSMTVNGNTTPYRHSAMEWLNDATYSNYYGTMCWTGRDYGDSWVYEFVLLDESVAKYSWNAVPIVEQTMMTSVKSNCHFGPINGIRNFMDNGELAPVLEFLNLKYSEIYSFGTMFGFTLFTTGDSQRRVLIPKSIINEVAVTMVGLPRTKDALQVCIRTMKRYLNKLSISAELKLDCAIYGSALAFVVGLDSELGAFNQLCSAEKHSKYNALNGVLALTGVWSIRKHIGILGLLTGIPTIALMLWRVKNFKQPPLSRHAKFITAMVSIGTVALLSRRVKNNAPANITQQIYETNRQSAASPSFSAPVVWPNGLPGYRSESKLLTTRKNCTIEVPDQDSPPDKPQLHPNCITFSNYIPIVPYNDLTNEVVAVNNRALMQVPAVDTAVFKLCTQPLIDSLVEQMGMISYEDELTDFVAWNSYYPSEKQKRNLLAYNNLHTTGWLNRYGVRKSFVKREVTIPKDHNYGYDFEDMDPRLIQGVSDEANVALGPFMRKVSKRLAEVWNADHRVFYASGTTGSDIGAWREKFSDRSVTLIEIDQSRYDAHQGVSCYEIENSVYSAVGIDQTSFARESFCAQRNTIGYCSNGTKYQVGYTRKSGDQNTSVGNSIINGIVTTAVLNKHGLTGTMVVLGDDNLIVVEGRVKVNEQSIIDSFEAYGFKAKVKVAYEWHEVEFCSSLFWPVQDGYVLGPKIGRRLPKVGFNLRHLADPFVKGMLIGFDFETGELPCFRVYTAHCLSLLTGVEQREYIDPEQQYKIKASNRPVFCDATADFFYARYGVTVKIAETTLRKSLRTAHSIRHMISWELLTEVFTKIDC